VGFLSFRHGLKQALCAQGHAEGYLAMCHSKVEGSPGSSVQQRVPPVPRFLLNPLELPEVAESQSINVLRVAQTTSKKVVETAGKYMSAEMYCDAHVTTVNLDVRRCSFTSVDAMGNTF
jgi:hypothetical protein